MFADIESMKDMLVENFQHKRYVPILLLSRFTDVDHLKTKEAMYMLFVWKEELVHFLSRNDAGCIINSGNVLVLIEKERSTEFLSRVKKLRILSKIPKLETDALIMSDENSKLFLDYA